MMRAVEAFIDNPGEGDIPLSGVFTAAMFDRLLIAMAQQGWSGIDKVADMWREDFSKRTLIKGFLKDKELGAKRLASMPDRVTNTINTTDGKVVYRPTVINNYQQEMRDLGSWFDQWYEFMFATEVSIKGKRGDIKQQKVCELLQPIPRSKYPAITEEEEAISIPLQLLVQALFDAVLVHIMNACAGPSVNWHELKLQLCRALVLNKQDSVLRVLAEYPGYSGADVIFLQEAAGAFVEAFRAHELLNSRFVLLAPKAIDHVRDQNSVVLVARSRLADEAQVEEFDVSAALGSAVPVADGDLATFAVPLHFGSRTARVVLASFHGDTAGLSSLPVTDAVRRAASAGAEGGLPIVMGMDANSQRRQDPKGATLYVGDFVAALSGGGQSDATLAPLEHSWEGEDTTKWHTTFNARTFLQPQLNKAVRFEERATSSLTDCHPKDFIVFSQGSFGIARHAVRDNTGRGEFVEEMDFPTSTFPSDHAIVSAALRWKSAL